MLQAYRRMSLASEKSGAPLLYTSAHGEAPTVEVTTRGAYALLVHKGKTGKSGRSTRSTVPWRTGRQKKTEKLTGIQ